MITCFDYTVFRIQLSLTEPKKITSNVWKSFMNILQVQLKMSSSAHLWPSRSHEQKWLRAISDIFVDITKRLGPTPRRSLLLLHFFEGAGQWIQEVLLELTLEPNSARDTLSGLHPRNINAVSKLQKIIEKTSANSKVICEEVRNNQRDGASR